MKAKTLSSAWMAVALLGCGAEMAGGAADDGTAPDGGSGGSGAAIEPITTAFHDERGDVIDFDAGDPVFTHAGPQVDLGGASCPDVFAYGYLLDENPRFTREVTRNPLSFAFAVRDAGQGEVTYRVRHGDTVVRDWTRANVDAGVAAITLHRDGALGIPELGSVDGTYTIDARQGEEMASTCWRHHPLAAPVSISRSVVSNAPDALAQFTFAADSPVSRLVAGDVVVFVTHIRHPLAEPVSLRVEVGHPEVAYVERVVRDAVAPTPINADYVCSTSFPQEDCATTAPAPTITTHTGSLADPQWRVDVLDAVTRLPAQGCQERNGDVTCELPARRIGEPARDILLVSSLGGAFELATPTQGQLGEFTLAGNTFTGRDPATTGSILRCQTFGPLLLNPPRHQCLTALRYVPLVAADQVQLDVGGVELRVKTALPGQTLSTPPFNGVVPGMPLAWDSGDDDLPGAQ